MINFPLSLTIYPLYTGGFHATPGNGGRASDVSHGFQPVDWGKRRISIPGSYFELYIHLIGAVKNREPWLTKGIEQSVMDIIKMKAVSSYFANHNLGKVLYWQEGYGALSVSKKRLEMVCGYVENQKVHHTQKNEKEML